jgi:hypothetical protein
MTGDPYPMDLVARLTQRNHTAALRAMAEVSQRRVAELLGLAESSLSEHKDRHLERSMAILAACGLKVVPCTARTYSDEHIQALQTLAAIGLRANPDALDSWRGDL